VTWTYVLTVQCGGSPGWFVYNGFCYFISPRDGPDGRKTWHDAQQYCLSNGGHLASIHTLQENQYLVTLVRDYVVVIVWWVFVVVAVGFSSFYCTFM